MVTEQDDFRKLPLPFPILQRGKLSVSEVAASRSVLSDVKGHSPDPNLSLSCFQVLLLACPSQWEGCPDDAWIWWAWPFSPEPSLQLPKAVS